MSDVLPAQPVCKYCGKPKSSADARCNTPGCPGSIVAQNTNIVNG